MREEARTAADRLEALVKEREAERKQLLETQAALSEALSHFETVSNEAEVHLCSCKMYSCNLNSQHMSPQSITHTALKAVRLAIVF